MLPAAHGRVSARPTAPPAPRWSAAGRTRRSTSAGSWAGTGPRRSATRRAGGPARSSGSRRPAGAAGSPSRSARCRSRSRSATRCPPRRTKSVSYALKLLVASRVPTRANGVQAAPRPARQHPLEPRPADLLPAGHVAGRGGDHHAAVDQPGQVVDLARVVAAVGHRHHRDRRPRGVDAEPDRVGRPAPVRVEHRAHPRVAPGDLLARTGRWCPPACRARPGPRAGSSTSRRIRSRQPDDGLALVVDRDDDRDPRASHPHPPAGQAPHVDDRLVGLEVARSRRAARRSPAGRPA